MTKTMILIDGPSQMYRALFSPGPRLTGPEGNLTAGTYIFTRILLKVIREQKPSFVAVALDPPRKQLARRELYAPYKRNRRPQKQASEAFEQLKDMIAVVKALGIHTVKTRAWEADDVIATLVKRYGKGKRVLIVSSDKDLHQLVSKTVHCFDPRSNENITLDDVKARWGVLPKQVVDVQTLAGDSTDNIPGVKGVGVKTAVRLIKEYGSALRVKAAHKRLSPALRAAMVAADLKTCRRLVELNSDLRLKTTEDDLRFDGLNMEAAKPVFRRLGFTRFARETPPKRPDRTFFGDS